MAFGDDLGEKVAEIRQAALDAYAKWLRVRSLNDITLNDGRTSVEAPGLPSDIVEAEQADFELFLTELDELTQRFEKYYPLNAAELSAVRSRLSRTDITALGENWAGGVRYTEQWPIKVVDRIDYAASIVLQAAEPPHMQASDRTWSGSAADAFNDDFLLPFQEFAAKQIFGGVYLANVAKIFFNATVGTQRDLKAIADACLAAFRDEPASLSETASATSLFADLMGFVLPSPIDDLVDATSIALEGAASRAEKSEDPPEWSIERSLRPWEVVASTMDVLTRLEQQLADDDDRIRADMDKDVSDYFYSADFQLRPERPDPPDRVDEELVVNIESIYEYGSRYMPAAAAQYAEANRQLDECDIPDWFGDLLLTRSRREFLDARSALRPALVWTRDYLTEAGEALVSICNEYQWADAASAAEFAEFKESLPPPQAADRPAPRPQAFPHGPVA